MLPLLSEENHDIFMSDQCQIGVALYMDYVLTKHPFHKMELSEENRNAWWTHNVYYALASTDEYVWCYSEKMNWWKSSVFSGGREGILSATEKYYNGLPLGYELSGVVPNKVIKKFSPSVHISGPENFTILKAPTDVTIHAEASGENIGKIQFYMNNHIYYESDKPVDEYTWGDLPPGSYTFLSRVFSSGFSSKKGTSGSIHVIVSESGSGVDSPNTVEPSHFRLSQNFPNPFNPMTTITYSLPHEEHITLTISAVTGQTVCVLKDEFQPAGEYSITWDASDIPSGLYFCTMHAGEISETRKMVFMK